MATFIKLLGGQIINSAQIAKIDKRDRPNEEKAKVQATGSSRFDGYAFALGLKSWEDKQGVDAQGVVTVSLIDGSSLNFPFSNLEDRDAELQRLEKILLPGVTPVFSGFALDLNSVQVLHFSWQPGDWIAPKLVASIKVADAEPYQVEITNDLMEQATVLASQFGVTIPIRPKTASEMIYEEYNSPEQ